MKGAIQSIAQTAQNLTKSDSKTQIYIKRQD